jgi:hypothetical protein
MAADGWSRLYRGRLDLDPAHGVGRAKGLIFVPLVGTIRPDAYSL